MKDKGDFIFFYQIYPHLVQKQHEFLRQRQNLIRQTIDRMSMTAKRVNITILEVVGVARETSETAHCRGLIQLAQSARDPPPPLPELEGRT